MAARSERLTETARRPIVSGVSSGEEVHAFDEHVGGHGEQAALALQDRGVVAGAENDRAAGRQQRAHGLDEPVLGAHARGAAGALRRDGVVTGISRAGVSAGRAGGGGDSGAASGSGGRRAIASTSSMLST